MDKIDKYVVCLTTVGKNKDGEKIARHLVEKKLVACVNLIPNVVSHYYWKKKICREKEVVLLMKTMISKVKALEKELHALHPYELPEFVVLPLKSGSRGYLDWIKKSLKS